MKNRIPLAIVFVIVLCGSMAFAQAPGGRGRGGGPGGRGPGRGGTERLADDLNLSPDLRDQLHSALLAYDQSVREQTLKARSALLDKMQAILPQDQFGQFKDNLQQVPLIAPVPPLRGVASSDLIDRVMGFDQNKDGKISKDELPERMANLMDQGDTNHDGYLDSAEIKNLADRNGIDNQQGRGRGGRRGGPPPGGFGQGF